MLVGTTLLRGAAMRVVVAQVPAENPGEEGRKLATVCNDPNLISFDDLVVNLAQAADPGDGTTDLCELGEELSAAQCTANAASATLRMAVYQQWMDDFALCPEVLADILEAAYPFTSIGPDASDYDLTGNWGAAGFQYGTRGDAGKALMAYIFRMEELSAWRTANCEDTYAALPTCISSVVEAALPFASDPITSGWVPAAGIYAERKSLDDFSGILRACDSTTFDCPMSNVTTDSDDEDQGWAVSYCATGEGGANVCIYDEDPADAEDECCDAKVGRTTNRPDLVPLDYCLYHCRPLECPLSIGKYGVIATTVEATGEPVECRYGVTDAQKTAADVTLWALCIVFAILAGGAYYLYTNYYEKKPEDDVIEAIKDRYRYKYNEDEKAGPIDALVRRSDPKVEVQAKEWFAKPEEKLAVDEEKGKASGTGVSSAVVTIKEKVESEDGEFDWSPSRSKKHVEKGTIDEVTLKQAGTMVPYDDAVFANACYCCEDPIRFVFIVLANNQQVLSAGYALLEWLASVAINFAALLGNSGSSADPVDCADAHDDYPSEDANMDAVWCDQSQRDGEEALATGATYALFGMLLDVLIFYLCWNRPQFLPGSPYNHMHVIRTAHYGRHFPDKHRRPSNMEIQKAVEDGSILREEDIKAKLEKAETDKGMDPVAVMTSIADQASAAIGAAVEAAAEVVLEVVESATATEDASATVEGENTPAVLGAGSADTPAAKEGAKEASKDGEEEKEDFLTKVEGKAEILLGDYLHPVFPWWLKGLLTFHRIKCTALLLAIYVEYQRAHAEGNTALMITQGVATLQNLPSGIMGAVLLFFFFYDVYLVGGFISCWSWMWCGYGTSQRLDPTGAPPGDLYELEPLTTEHPASSRSYNNWNWIWNLLTRYGL